MLWNTKCKHGTHTMCPLLLIRMKIMWVKNNTNLNKWTWNVHRHAAHSGCNSVWSSMCVKEQKKTKHHGWEYKANHSFVLIFFSWATWFKKEMAYSDYATGADMEGVYRGMQKRCQWNNTDRKHLQFNLSDFILISKCAFVCFSWTKLKKNIAFVHYSSLLCGKH